jgi:ubiquitin-protein ligase
MSPRLRRLQSDYEKIQSRFAEWPRIRVASTRGDPPEFYQIEYEITGLAKQADGRIIEVSSHFLEINLSLQYPRRAPTCRITTPIFHPNIDASSVCIGDFWASSEALDSLIIRIGRMIAFQEYNVKSPLDGIAARWASENVHLLPVDARPVEAPGTSVIEADQLISIVEDLHPDPDYKYKPEELRKDADQAVVGQEEETILSGEGRRDVESAERSSSESLENLIVVGEPSLVESTVITLPNTLEFVNLQARCRKCACLLALESEHLAINGFSCPQCAAYHALK